MISAALIVLVEMGSLSAWIAIVIISREFMVTGLRTIAAANGQIIAASKAGKLKTVTQIIAISALFLEKTLIEINLLPEAFIVIFTTVMLWLAVLFTVYSGLDYLIKGWKVFTSSK